MSISYKIVRLKQKTAAEDHRAIIRLGVTAGSIVALLILFYLWFFVATANINSFWGLFRGHQENEASGSSWFNALPPVPTLTDIPEAINKKTFAVKGYSQVGLKAILFVNESETAQTIVDNNGIFYFDGVSLASGSATIYIKIKNDKNQESGPSKAYTILFDDKPPQLEIKKPQDGDKFIDPGPFYSVEGTVNEEASVFVNDHLATLDFDKTFRLTITCKEGDNFLKIKAVDKAGNETILGRKLVYEKP